MHPDDVKAALDALASEGPGPQRGRADAVARGRRRITQRRFALAGIAAVFVAAVAIVGAASGSGRNDQGRVTAVPTTAPFVPQTETSVPRPTTPTTIAPAPPPQPVQIPIAVASPSEAWLCSAPAEYTADGGVNWRNVNSTASSAPIAQYPQEPLCTAVPGGTAWKLAPSYDPARPQLVRIQPGQPPRAIALSVVPQYTPISDLVFVDERHGWMLTQKSELAKSRELFTTSNGGASWIVDYDTPVSGGLRFASATEGWAGSNRAGGEVLHTIDGGRSWTSVRVPVDKGFPGLPVGLRDIVATDDAIIALGGAPTGNNMSVFFDVSTDGGRTWRKRSGPRQPFGTTEPMAFSAVDADHWQLSALNQLWTTADGGRRWIEVAQFAGLSQIDAVAFLTPDAGFVSGRGSRLTQSATVVLQTTDAGASWAMVDAQGPPLPANAPVVNTPGGFIGCPTRPLTPPPAGNPPPGLVDAAKAYVKSSGAPTPVTVDYVYRVGANPKGSFGYLFKFQVGSCGPATLANAWVVELTGPLGGAAINHTQLVLAHYADGWHMFGRYH